MALHILTGAGEIRVDSSATGILRHNMTSVGEVLVEGTAHLTFIRALTGAGEILIEGQADLVPILPTVLSVVPSSPTVLRMTFDEPMLNNAALVDPANYAVASLGAGVPIAMQSVVAEAVTFPTYVDLTTTEHTDAESYEASVSGITSQLGESIDPLFDTGAYTGIGLEPRVSSAIAINATKVRVTFDEPMDKNGTELGNPLNYTVVPTAGGASVFVSLVTLPVGVNPSFVELVITEMTDGEAYEVAVNSTGPIRDAAFNPLDNAFDTAAFTGAGDAPVLLRVVPISNTRVDVIFSETMKDNADIRDQSNYVWDNGLVTLSVLDFDGDTVKLATSEQVEGLLYQLTIG